jgi:uncharacterized membrane protein
MYQIGSDADVFRIRNHQPTRLEGFVDAAFAFAVTLVVISIGHVPVSVPEMLKALRGLPTFALCFLVIARFWRAHRDFSRHYGLEDTTTTRLSLLLVFVILVYVYPLRLLFGFLFAAFSHGWLADQPLELNSPDELRAAYIVYGIGFAAIALLFVLLHRHALAQSQALDLSAGEILYTRMRIAMWGAIASVAGLSILCAIFVPFLDNDMVTPMLPGLVYFAIWIVLPLMRRHARRLAASPTQ